MHHPVDPLRNPYAPGAGTPPPALRGRDGELKAFRILLERLRRGRSEKSLLVSGLRGVGKTVLLNAFASIARSENFITAASEITHETNFRALMARRTQRALGEISPARRILKETRKALGVLQSFSMKLPDGPEFRLNIEAASGYGDSGILHEDLTDLFQALGEAVAKRKRGVVFLFDEMQLMNKGDLEALIAALHKASQHSLPITCIGAGLPQLPARAMEAKSYAERLFDFPKIGTLPPEAAREALCLPALEKEADFENAAVENILSFTEGYPYFLQLYGRYVWDRAAGPTITLADTKAVFKSVQDQLDDSFFSVRMERCTKTELAYLQAMGTLGKGPHQSGVIASALGRDTSSDLGAIRANLIEKGLIYSVARGQNDFTVPHFADFLRRNYPRGE